MIRYIFYALGGTFLFFIACNIFSIVFWHTGLNEILDVINIDDIKVEEVNNAESKERGEL